MAVILVPALALSAQAERKTAKVPERRDLRIEFRADDGTALEAMLSLPPASSGAASPPLVFYVHGAGPRTYENPYPYIEKGKRRRANFLDLHARELTRRGVGFFRMSKRGCSVVAKPPFIKLDRKIFSGATCRVLLADYAAALRVLTKRDDVDASRIVLWGSSEGTRLAPQLALAQPKGIRGVVLDAYAGDDMQKTVEWQNLSGPWRKLQLQMPAARDGKLERKEYDEFAKKVPVLTKSMPWAAYDVDKDGVIDAADIEKLMTPRLKKLQASVKDGDEDWVWKNVLRLSPAYLREGWGGKPSPDNLLALDVPIAIFHGEFDGTCRVEAVRVVEAAFAKAKRQGLTCHYYPEADHGLEWSHAAAQGKGPKPFRDACTFVTTVLSKKPPR